jgi:hypothetical protein
MAKTPKIPREGLEGVNYQLRAVKRPSLITISEMAGEVANVSGQSVAMGPETYPREDAVQVSRVFRTADQSRDSVLNFCFVRIRHSSNVAKPASAVQISNRRAGN